MALSTRPAGLTSLELQAVETWTEPGRAPEVETDQVRFYHGVPIEVQMTEAGAALSPGARERQQHDAAKMRRQIDRVCHGSEDDGQLLNLNGEIWALSRFEALFDWTTRADGPRQVLTFRPKPGIHSNSRMETVLAHTVGELEVDPATGQILSGSFHNVGSVSFGAGLLARIRSFRGTFEMQAVGPVDAPIWVMRQVTVTVDGHKLFRRMRGTETMTYTVAK